VIPRSFSNPLVVGSLLSAGEDAVSLAAAVEPTASTTASARMGSYQSRDIWSSSPIILYVTYKHIYTHTQMYRYLFAVSLAAAVEPTASTTTSARMGSYQSRDIWSSSPIILYVTYTHIYTHTYIGIYLRSAWRRRWSRRRARPHQPGEAPSSRDKYCRVNPPLHIYTYTHADQPDTSGEQDTVYGIHAYIYTHAYV